MAQITHGKRDQPQHSNQHLPSATERHQNAAHGGRAFTHSIEDTGMRDSGVSDN